MGGGVSSSNGRELNSDGRPTYLVEPGPMWAECLLQEPPPSMIRLTVERESLVFSDPANGQPLRVFPFVMVICWGHRGSSFHFQVLTKDHESFVVSVRSPIPQRIEEDTMSTVLELMDGMKSKGSSEEDLSSFLETVQWDVPEEAQEQIRSFCARRRLTSHQAAAVLSAMEERGASQFEQIDAACLLHEFLLNGAGTFQVVLNHFNDINTRENICIRSV